MTGLCDFPLLDLHTVYPNADHPTMPDTVDLHQGYFNAASGALLLKSYAGLISPPQDLHNQTAGEAWAIRDNLYFDGTTGSWFKIDNDAVPIKIGTLRGVALAAATGASTNNSIRIKGLLWGYSGLTVGGKIYPSGTAGGYSQTKPSPVSGGSQVAICEMGEAVSASAVWINPSPIYYAKCNSMAADATLTITHHKDPAPHKRKVRAEAYTTVTILTENYASANQDTDFQLRGQSGAGNTLNLDTVGAAAFTLGDAAGTDWRIAQSFTTVAGLLTSITIRFGATTGVPTAAPTWSIKANSGGNPTGATLATGTMSAITQNTDNTITLSTPLFLAAGFYWLVLELPIQTTNRSYSVLYNGANPYGGGELKADSTTTTFPNTWVATAAGKDLRCSIVVAAITLHDRIAQSFSRNRASVIPSVRLWMKRVGSPPGNLTLTLYPDVAGSPGPTPITNGTSNTVSSASLGTSYGWVTFTFTTPPSLAANTTYWIVLSTSDAASTTAYVIWGCDTSSPSYANGSLKTETSSVWSGTPAADGCFEVNSYDSYFEPLAIGRYAGASDMGARFDDGAEANTETATTFKNTSGSTLDVTCFVDFEEAS